MRRFLALGGREVAKRLGRVFAPGVALFVALPMLAGAGEAPMLVEYLPEAALSAAGAEGRKSAVAAMREGRGVKALRFGLAAPATVLQARALSIVLPGSGETLTFDDLEVEVLDSGYALHSGDGASTTSIALVIAGEDVVGTLHHDGAVYGVHPLGDGFTAVYLYDAALINPHHEPDGDVVVPDPDAGDPHPRPPPPAAGKQDRGDVIDLLVAYTARAKRAVGNVDAALALYVLESNMKFRNSGVSTRWRLAHGYETPYREDPDSLENLERLRLPGDGFLDEAHEMRDLHRADIVVLLYAENRNVCHGRAYRPNHSRGYFSEWAFGVVGVGPSCSAAAASSVFAHEVAHVQGTGHNPEETTFAEGRYPYGHGLCNTRGRWRTVMAYNSGGRCPQIVPYYSNPDVLYRGTPTGDREKRNNVRVIHETAFTVANFRTRDDETPGRHTHRLPLMPGAGEGGIQGFVRIRNRSAVAGEVEVHAFDDAGRSFGPVTFAIEAGHSGGFNSADLENGNASRGLPAGIGDGTGSWRLELVTSLDIEAHAYIRTSEGFLTSMDQLAREDPQYPNRYLVPFFNPASNTSIRSLLRIANPNPATVHVTLWAWDSHGQPAEAAVVFLLRAGAAVLLTSQLLEAGDAQRFTGRFGDGEGKWRLEVSGTHPLEVMSLLATRSGHLTNLSR